MIKKSGLKSLAKRIFGAQTGRSAITVITFTGGMGAQIISAAIYLSMKEAGQAVYADLSYFDRDVHLATPGKQGDCSHWPWQLDVFGLHRTSFETLQGYSKREVNLIEDGREKLSLALKAMVQPEVQKYFAVPGNVDDILPPGTDPVYLCVHVRRGDYVNVASHLVSDSEFVGLSAKFAGLVKSIVIVSDSPLEPAFRQQVSAGFEQAVFLDDIDAFGTHRVMRNARILVCSNSQFSLIGAMMNHQALAIMPKQWFGESHRALEEPINEVCDFQILA